MSNLIPGEIVAALAQGYRVEPQPKFFPFESLSPTTPGTVHAVVDHGARAIFCSAEWFEKSRVKA